MVMVRIEGTDAQVRALIHAGDAAVQDYLELTDETALAVRDTARAEVSQRSRRIPGTVVSERRSGRMYAVVKAGGKGAPHANLIEGGTKPHAQPKRKWQHPGAKAYPFMAPAADRHRTTFEQRAEALVDKHMGWA